MNGQPPSLLDAFLHLLIDVIPDLVKSSTRSFAVYPAFAINALFDVLAAAMFIVVVVWGKVPADDLLDAMMFCLAFMLICVFSCAVVARRT